MEKTILVDGKEVRMRASALVPRLYRFKFGRDLIQDLMQLRRNFEKAKALPADASPEERAAAQLSVLDLTIFENVAYIMAKHGDPQGVPATIEEWMEGFALFSIYEVLPQILELWDLTNRTTSTAKKN